MNNISNEDGLDRILAALGEQLAREQLLADLVVIGGSGLLALGYVDRPTLDVDVVAFGAGSGLVSSEPFPSRLVSVVRRVAVDFGLNDDWLNPGPADLITLGFPKGFEKRLVVLDYGEFLKVRLASRFDQIHFKLYALVDQGPGRHEADLRSLNPSDEELLEAGRWALTHDISDSFRANLAEALAYLGVDDADQLI